ncbi:MAG: Zn-dependent hydrolase of the beta-lactamase fold-like protein [Parcubacteria group bacterium GW2011_GWD2_38_12]|uniref:Zn-dependent hydrolase n=1 Tax=Candidatus Azambacteria bacterium RIFCSPLOWO2_01_FULL_37_9 TaxID=1797297 RepID=A0A1F5C6L6_9BACT|nr:MAG: Zn-dependent hydrolase of the beta-lactamase fold-like protein [Parcubacteria group bacterium GW2011_GWC2_36_17]KKQ43808.1 MAG: Zn-dependent hydrolase of the beta-lactamase fold-like protein [Parcubacteria group bacterium GW2011_GWE2_37_8]KKQ51458.1 MAG: Zn-dependent hydrolase of the beta-lactamase fold-like protein [Parcubacteria group bacterium GW2011_GWD2_38_12]KKQ58717.1 MAG: Zn-dependent hydrolase of the beta-lactamase fold-like protein [Parcubacteria group bacterium GW2011_GWC1_38_
MQIQWYGQSCFKIQSGDVTIIIDPFDKKIGLTPPRGKTDIVLSTHDHMDHNNSEGFDDVFFINTPGEYEIKNAIIKGMSSFHDNVLGDKNGINTIYTLEIEGIKICHLGDLGQKELSSEQVDAIGNVDILMAPIGGEYALEGEKMNTLDAEGVKTIINQIEPRIMVPMHYFIKGLGLKMDGPEKFFKMFNVSEKDAVLKFSIKKKDLPQQEEPQIIIMKID